MPLYEYKCKSCGQLLEVIQKFSDEPLTECPKCKGTLERLLSAPAIQFKGSGWYVTDYARKGRSEDSTKETKPESKEKSDSGQSKAGSPAKESKPSTGKKSSD